MTKSTWFFVFLRKQPFTKLDPCVRALEYSLFVLANSYVGRSRLRRCILRTPYVRYIDWVRVGRNHGMVCDNFCKLLPSLECILVDMDWYDSPIGYNFRIRYAVEVDNPRCTESSRLGCLQSQRRSIFHVIVLFDLFLPFSFQQLGCFVLCRYFM